MKMKAFNYREKKKINIMFHSFNLIILLVLVFYINREITYLALHMDDMNLYEEFKTHSWLELFTESHFGLYYRPFSMFVMKIIMQIVGEKIYLIDIFLKLFYYGIIAVFYSVCFEFSKSKLITVLLSICAILSHFSSYFVTNFYGIMESMGVISTLIIVCILCRFYDSTSEKRTRFCWGIACIIYFMAYNIHERYLTLILVFILIPLLKFKEKRKRAIYISVPIFMFTTNIITRIVLLGTNFVNGGGGTHLQDTFNLQEVISHSYISCLAMFGFCDLPGYLNGVNHYDLELVYQNIAIGLALITLLYLVIWVIVVSGYKKEERRELLCKSTVIIITLGVLLGAASITIRIETRWLYASYLLSLVLIGYIYSILKEYYAEQKLPYYKCLFYFIVCAYLYLTAISEVNYRTYYNHLYFWYGQMQCNELYEILIVDVGKEELTEYDKVIVIGMSWEENFLEPYYQESDLFYPNLYYYESMESFESENSESYGENILFLEWNEIDYTMHMLEIEK